jgi:Tol biopolymer transport system component
LAKVIAKVAPVGQYANPELSPDGKRLAVEIGALGKRDIWILELERERFVRFTFEPALYHLPVWSPDGSRIVFASNRNSTFDLYWKPSNQSSDEQLLYKSDLNEAPYSWSADGKYLAYRTLSESGGAAIWALPLFGERVPIRFNPSPFSQTAGRLSPDGKWVAYSSDETGRSEIVVQTFPKPGGKWQISTAGGIFPRWRRDGKELYFQALDGKLMAVPISYGRTGDVVIEPGTPAPLFEAHTVGGPSSPTGFRQQYDVSSDGQRFLLNLEADNEKAAPPFTVVMNWTALLKK